MRHAATVLCVAAFACNGQVQRTPIKHRAEAGVCPPIPRASFSPDPPDGGTGDADCIAAGKCDCASDSQCVSPVGLSNGRCGYTTLGCTASTYCWRCSYDQCQSDSDCKTSLGVDGICYCRSDPDHPPDTVTSPYPNLCGKVPCATDSECGPPGVGYCSPFSPYPCAPTQLSGYQCHTDRDECLNDIDCPNTHWCGWNPTSQHFWCGDPLVGYCADGG